MLKKVTEAAELPSTCCAIWVSAPLPPPPAATHDGAALEPLVCNT